MKTNTLIYTLLSGGFLFLAACSDNITPRNVVSQKPSIFPDYTEVTIPATIAPLNFRFNGDYSEIDAVIEGGREGKIHLRDKKQIDIPERKWNQLLDGNKGDSIRFTVSVKQQGGWVRYAPFSIYVSSHPIDHGLVYRLLAPGYEVYSKMGIYQRNLSNFEEKPIFENTLIPGSCVNCHSFRLTDPKFMNLHIRGKKGGTILVNDGNVKILNTKTPKTISNFVYPFWHPSGNFVAYSVNNIKQVFHEARPKKIEVIDLASDIVVYDINKNETIFSDKLMTDTVFETFPTFSPDGKTLYYCAASAKVMPNDYKEVRYNLRSLVFNPETGSFGDSSKVLFDAASIGKSVTFPRPSPDGRYIMFTLTDYGNFSIWHKEADLWLLDLTTGECRVMEAANSSDTESYHSWSSNSRWFVFSSRRIDGLYTRPFIASIDTNGKISKPFLLPQKNPEHNDALLSSYNIPEFISDEVQLDMHMIEDLVNTKGTNVTQRE